MSPIQAVIQLVRRISKPSPRPPVRQARPARQFNRPRHDPRIDAFLARYGE